MKYRLTINTERNIWNCIYKLYEFHRIWIGGQYKRTVNQLWLIQIAVNNFRLRHLHLHCTFKHRISLPPIWFHVYIAYNQQASVIFNKFLRSNLGKSHTMLGTPEAGHTLGAIPCAIAWLFRGISEQRQRTGARFSVRVSCVELTTGQQQLRDLLAAHANGE